MPGSRLEIFEAAGHFLHVEEPERLAVSMRDFIDSTRPNETKESTYRDRLLGRLRVAG